MNINFITTESLTNYSGGWSGINYYVYQYFIERFNVNYIGPVYPKVNKSEAFYSKIQKGLGIKRNFYFFSENRLNKINNIVKGRLTESGYNFFWGQTPWIKCIYDIPYGVYLDASFSTFAEVYLNINEFKNSDIQRIIKLEEEWLNNASHVFWGSGWALEIARLTLNLKNNNNSIVWVGGNLEVPEKDSWDGTLQFTFISLRFREKGGYVAFEAFKKVHELYPDTILNIIGQKPPAEVLQYPGVIYSGYLHKNVPEELQSFTKIMSESFCLIHPTTMDTMGAVIIESGYFGAPSIAPASFGIPELILHNKTGLVLDLPINSCYFATSMIYLIEHPDIYRNMRKNTRDHCTTNLTYKAMTNKMAEKISAL
jgi:glycosyltransferase involved in cell wall biosynthesis